MKYCVDTNIFIDVFRRLYPKDVFITLWENFELLVEGEEIVAPRQVYIELIPKDDELAAWAKGHKKMFLDLTEAEQSQIGALIGRYPSLTKLENPNDEADPFIIILAKSRELTVVTMEKEDGRIKIPYVCRELGLRCLDIVGLSRENSWRF